ncbi:MAG: hypothetical protein JXR84_26240 [Anaerolineae bacterium]|nr:hypothetical protein [Anaerolineae bacterium]
MDELKALLEKIGSIGDEINVNAAFGEPETVGERVLIPVAEITYGFGAGMGTAGPGTCCEESCDEEGDESCECECHEESGEGAGGGGGGAGGRARPIAYIEVGPDGTKVEPIMDEQKIALAGMLLGAWAIAWVGMVLVTLFHAITGRE